jgi:hypothetical protein
MKTSLLRHFLLSAAAGLGCLTIAHGFHAAGQAGVQEALFLGSLHYDGTVNGDHCRRARAQSPDETPARLIE